MGDATTLLLGLEGPLAPCGVRLLGVDFVRAVRSSRADTGPARAVQGRLVGWR